MFGESITLSFRLSAFRVPLSRFRLPPSFPSPTAIVRNVNRHLAGVLKFDFFAVSCFRPFAVFLGLQCL